MCDQDKGARNAVKNNFRLFTISFIPKYLAGGSEIEPYQCLLFKSELENVS